MKRPVAQIIAEKREWHYQPAADEKKGACHFRDSRIAELLRNNLWFHDGKRTTMQLAAYPRPKPSGVEWLGAVPEHWEVPVTLGLTRPDRP